MSSMDKFTAALAIVAFLLVSAGIRTLGRRELEIGALVGAVPLRLGLGIGALAAFLFALEHVAIRVV